MIIYGSKNLFRRKQQTRHLPNCHFKVHLGELEQPASANVSVRRTLSNRSNGPLEEPGHLQSLWPANGSRPSKIWGTSMLAGKGDVWIHEVNGLKFSMETTKNHSFSRGKVRTKLEVQ